MAFPKYFGNLMTPSQQVTIVTLTWIALQG
jgi:hypothetical protein